MTQPSGPAVPVVMPRGAYDRGGGPQCAPRDAPDDLHSRAGRRQRARTTGFVQRDSHQADQEVCLLGRSRRSELQVSEGKVSRGAKGSGDRVGGSTDRQAPAATVIQARMKVSMLAL